MQSIGLLSIYFNFLDSCLIILFQNLPSCIVGHWTLCYGLFYLIVVNIKKGFLFNGLLMLQVKWPLHDNQSHRCISAVSIFVLCLFEIPQLFLVMIKAGLFSLFMIFWVNRSFLLLIVLYVYECKINCIFFRSYRAREHEDNLSCQGGHKQGA